VGRRRTDDEIIAQGDIWRGDTLELRQRMSDFTVDGVRFGAQLADTRSGSKHDRRLSKESEEVVTAAFILGRLGYSRVRLSSKDESGRKLERPDLDAKFEDGTTLGIEVAQVGTTGRMKHDANLASLEHRIRDLIDSDAEFSKDFGPYYLSVSPSSVLGERDVANKRQVESMLAEVIAFIKAKGHQLDNDADRENGYFGREYPMLHARGATYYSSSAAYGPYFAVMDGGTVNPNAEVGEVIRVLDSHRERARRYRVDRAWLLMYLADSNEIFRGTIAEIKKENPNIAPFEQCHLADACWRLTTLRGR
jgi:hypothetical protein